jgi:hypothetical protein
MENATKVYKVLRPLIDELRTLIAGVASVAPPSTPTVQYQYIFRPGGVAGGNVYTTFAALYAAASTHSGPVLVQVDTAGGANPAHVTGPAVYNLNGWIFVPTTGPSDVLVFDPGATIVSPTFLTFANTLTVAYDGGAAGALAPSAAHPSNVYVLGGANLRSVNALSPFFNGAGNIILDDTSTLGGNGNLVATNTTGEPLDVYAFNASGVGDGSVSKSGIGSASVNYDASSTPGAQGAGVSIEMIDLASAVNYPGGPDWGATPPTEAGDALDRIAAILSNHEIAESAGGGPIMVSPLYSTLAVISGFTPSAEGTGKVHVEATAALFSQGGIRQAAIGIAAVAHGSPAPTAPQYPPAGLGGNSISIAAADSACTSIICDFGAGGSFPAALPPLPGGWDIYLLGTADSAAPGVLFNDHGCQISAQEQL